MTEYVILSRTESGTWEDIGITSARSAKAAISQAITGPTGAPPKEGTFVAVPERSWRSVTVKVETKTALRFS